MTPVYRDDASAAFFDAAADGSLLIRRCTACGHFVAPGRSRCIECASRDLEWVQASGDATLVTWGVAHSRDGAERSVLGTVELAEGPWMNVALADDGALRAGVPMTVTFVQHGDGEHVPVFRPAPA